MFEHVTDEKREIFYPNKRLGIKEAQTFFEENVLVHLDAVYNYARSISDTDHGAEALVRETFFRAHEDFNPTMFSKYSSLWKVWIFCILRHFYETKFKPEQKSFREESEELTDEDQGITPPTSHNPNSEERPFEGVEPDKLFRLVENLPQPSRSCIILADVERFSCREIGVILSASKEAVTSQLKGARKVLKGQLLDNSPASTFPH